jgi:hypothetical protein
VLDGKIYVGSRDKKSVFILDAVSGRKLESISLEGVRHLAAGKEILAATDKGVIRLSDRKQLIDTNAMDVAGITVAPNGDILVSDSLSHQIHRFTADGKALAVIGQPGGPYKGAYDPAHMVNPAGLVFAPDGKLWVTEKRWNPKRVLAWDLTKNEVVYEKFGMPHYGGDGSGFDPENPGRWIGLGCFWEVDIAQKTARPTHILSMEEGHLGHYEPQSYSFFREAGRTFVSTRGKIALIAEVLPDGTMRDIAATAGTHHFSYAFHWKPPQAYIDAFYAKWPEKRKMEKPGLHKGEGKPWSQRGMGVLWVDRNGDGEPQQEEFDFCGDDIDYAGGAWGHLQNSLTFYLPVADKNQVKIAAAQTERIPRQWRAGLSQARRRHRAGHAGGLDARIQTQRGLHRAGSFGPFLVELRSRNECLFGRWPPRLVLPEPMERCSWLTRRPASRARCHAGHDGFPWYRTI